MKGGVFTPVQSTRSPPAHRHPPRGSAPAPAPAGYPPRAAPP